MSSKRRNFTRSTGTRKYRKIFVLAMEGTKTEKQYFDIFQAQINVHIKCLNSKNAPRYVLNTMKAYLKKERFRKNYEAWIIVDKDNWKDEHLTELYNWSATKAHFGLALSNPKFEYWLLLHYEDGHKIANTKDCDKRLKKHLPNYNKNISETDISQENINKAIARAEIKDKPPCKDWPCALGNTTVYRLVKKIVAEAVAS